ncbi:MAG: stage II sporulation protein D [Clostridia bacterium]|nr:stage II sporulation protein D [Clostridia bacterium]
MKSYTVICFFLSLSMILFPLVSVEKVSTVFANEFSIIEETLTNEKTEETETENSTVKVMNASSKNITEISLREYLIGVVAAEINPAYHEEAIKAQVVAAHTKLEYTKLHNTPENAHITDSPASHQGYLNENQQKEKWGENYNIYHDKIAECVDEVQNVILTYNNQPINAVFHAISNGQTENATDVWGGDYPYLVSVQSAGDKLSPAYNSEIIITSDDFKKKLSDKGVNLSGDPSEWIEKITNTNTGMVKEFVVGGKSFKGTEIRTIFGLKSSTFTVKYENNNFIFTVCGYGHGVGMSQYGANYMAQQGLNYKQILEHYYQNSECTSC